MKIVKEINGCKIEERYNPKNGKTFYVVWSGNEWNRAFTLDEAIALTYIITR